MILLGLLSAASATAGAHAGPAAPRVTFYDIAAHGGAGLGYERVPSTSIATVEAIRSLAVVTLADFTGPYPIKPHGAPGVALLDYDGDGDLDIFVTNGPGAPNSLFSSQLADTGELSFLDVAAAAGVGLPQSDSTGACFGDIDNDGDPDLYVLSRNRPNHLLENLGGVFREITVESGSGGGNLSSVSCAFGDVNGDGLLDLLVGNTFDMDSSAAIFLVPFALNQRNQLFLNTGGNGFADISEESGVAAPHDITWAVSVVDLDQDGDLDIVAASDNGAIPPAAFGGVDRGFVRCLKNDGTGHFTDVTADAGLLRFGDWMGLAFADLDGNGTLDIFASNSGDYLENLFGLLNPVGLQATRWFLQGLDGTFSDPGVGPLVASPFAWGTAAFDYDNDGDSDLVAYGGLDAGPLVEASNPGVLLANDGSAHFELDLPALAGGALHSHRIEHGLAVGDLDGNGFPDIVSVSAMNLPDAPPPFGPVPVPLDFGSIFDTTALFFPAFVPTPTPGELTWSGVEYERGTLAVELNSGGNGNGWIGVRTLGTAGITEGGRGSRDGIGAVVTVTPHRGTPAIQPVLGGSSYASQHALALTFGLGSARRATVDVLWPGRVRNRLYGVRSGERVRLPEIPCSIDGSEGPARYAACVRSSLTDLGRAGVLDNRQRARWLASALRAYAEEHP